MSIKIWTNLLFFLSFSFFLFLFSFLLFPLLFSPPLSSFPFLPFSRLLYFLFSGSPIIFINVVPSSFFHLFLSCCFSSFALFNNGVINSLNFFCSKQRQKFLMMLDKRWVLLLCQESRKGAFKIKSIMKK